MANFLLLKGIKIYTIKISYQTGDSFSTSEEEELIGCCWKNKNLAKEALQAIKEHHHVYASSGFRDTRTSEEKNKEASKFKWFYKEYPEGSIQLKLDNGEYKVTSVFWIGFFETLYGADIVVDNNKRY